MLSESQSTEDYYETNEYSDEDEEDEKNADESTLLDWEEAQQAFSGGQPADGVHVPSSSSAVVIELRGVRAMLGLDGCPADDLLELLGEHSREGVLTLGHWLTALRHLVRLGGGTDHDCRVAAKLGNKLFAQFDPIPSADHGDVYNEAVSYVNFTTGLVCLCASSLVDKVSVAWTLLDDDSDGFITQSQLQALVLCTLRTITAASNFVAAKVSVTGCTLEDLAGLVVQHAVIRFGLEDGELMDKASVLSICTHFLELAQQ